MLVVVAIVAMQLLTDVFEFELIGVEVDEEVELQVTTTFVVGVEFAEAAALLADVSGSVWTLLFVLSPVLLMSPLLAFELFGV